LKTITSQTFYPNSTVALSLPQDAQILSLGEKNGQIVVHALIDHTLPWVMRNIRVFESGASVPDDPTLTYIGTVFILGFYWHVFEDYRATMGGLLRAKLTSDING
jgi:hypothetical protein